MTAKEGISMNTMIEFINLEEKVDRLGGYYVPEKYNTLMNIFDQMIKDNKEEPRKLLYFTMFIEKIISTLTTSVEVKELMSEYDELLTRMIHEAYGRDPYQDPDQDF